MRPALLASAAALLLAGCGPITAGEDTTAAPSPPPPTASPEPAPSSTPPEPAPSSTPPMPGQRAEVVDVVDGDTVKVRTTDGRQLTVRVLGIDTPEVYGGAECWGPEASQFAERTLAGQTVGLVVDDTQDERDRYGRALRYLILPDGGNYSVLAADAGAARSYVYDTPVSEHEAIVAAEQRAQAADRGLWGACDGPEPTQTTEPAGDCAPGYDPCVPPYPPDVDCSDVDGPITVTGSDPHNLDGDGDGRACES
jgi:endonuclease YncB( thermonuclease family)